MWNPRLGLLALPWIVLGCDPVNAPELPDWSAGYPDEPGDPSPTDDTGAELAGIVTIAPVLEYGGRFGLASDIREPCTYDTTNGFSEVTCRLDANELDMFFHGWAYDVLVQAGTCTYLGIHNYMYQAWEIGFGEPLVQYRINANGDVIEDIQGSVNGQPSCQYDHSVAILDAPNCCLGTYQVQVLEQDGTPQELGPVTNWGGVVGDCYEGAAYHSNITELLNNNIPAYIITDIDETTNVSFSVTFDGPIETPQGSNVQVANYVNPVDETPVAFEGTYSVPLYTVECLDDAEEVQVRFLIEVRDWDTVAEFDAEGDEPGTGDPDIGQQAGPGQPAPLEDNGSGSPINDRWDWRDFGINEIDYVQFAD